MDLLWKPGSFAVRYPRIAAEIGKMHALESAAVGCLYDSAGTAPEMAIRDACCETYPSYPGERPPDTCCGDAGCCQPGSCCQLGTCAGCGELDEAWEGAYPEADAAIDEGRALSAAIRDIQADPDVEDVQGATEQAMALAKAGKLAAYYVPASPAKKLPNGSDAPACCPICGGCACSACGCCCQCCDSASGMGDMGGEAEG